MDDVLNGLLTVRGDRKDDDPVTWGDLTAVIGQGGGLPATHLPDIYYWAASDGRLFVVVHWDDQVTARLCFPRRDDTKRYYRARRAVLEWFIANPMTVVTVKQLLESILPQVELQAPTHGEVGGAAEHIFAELGGAVTRGNITLRERTFCLRATVKGGPSADWV